jgi:hypothetical protein
MTHIYRLSTGGIGLAAVGTGDLKRQGLEVTIWNTIGQSVWSAGRCDNGRGKSVVADSHS